MGFFTDICAIVRTVMFARASSAGKAADFSWTTIDLRVWGTLENQVGIIAACIPTVKPLYVQATSSVYTRWSRGKSSKGYAAQSDDQLHQLKPVRAKSKPHARPESHDIEAYGHGDQKKQRAQVSMEEFNERRSLSTRNYV